jgi:hypothetical protein
MKTFTIDSDNNITLFASKKEAAAASTTPFDPFASQSELAELAADWPMNRLVEIWNSIPGVSAVTKFTSRKNAVERIWKAIQNLGPTERKAAEVQEPVAEIAEPVAEVQEPVEPQPLIVEPAANEAPAAEEQPVTTIDAEVPAAEPVADVDEQSPDVALAAAGPATTPTRQKRAAKKATQPKAGVLEGSKTATLLALIQRPEGATLAELMTAASWQAHSVRGFISGTLGKKMGLTVGSAKREDGERVYTIAK